MHIYHEATVEVRYSAMPKERCSSFGEYAAKNRKRFTIYGIIYYDYGH